MILFLRYRLNLKIFSSFLLIILIAASSAPLIGYQIIRRTIEREIAIRMSTSMAAYRQEILHLEESCQRVSEELARERELVELLSLGRYEDLERRLVHYRRLGLAEIIEIEDSAGNVLLRGHHPEVAGDVKIDQGIVRQGLMGVGKVSYESGRSGLAIRAVSPIRSGERIIGVLMAGTLFSPRLAAHIKGLTGMDNGVYRDAARVVATYSGFSRLEPAVVERLRTRQTVFLRPPARAGEEASYLLLHPLFLADGTYWGALSLGLPARYDDHYLAYSQTLFVLTACIGLGLSLIIYSRLARNINHSLARILDGMNGFNLDRFDTRIELRSRDEFQDIAESFNRLAGQLAEYHRRIETLQEDMIRAAKLATAGQLAAGLAHEIRNPLSSIKMMAQILRSRPLGESGQREISTLLEETERINHLMRELLEFARPSPMRFLRQDANRIIGGVLELLRHPIEHQSIAVDCRLDPALQPALLDGEKFRQVVMNLLLNAIQAMPSGGRLEVRSLGLRDGRLLFRFCNSGPVIPEEDHHNIFEPFFTTKKEGTGLGLALCRAVVERHGGRISVSSREGRTCFLVELPQKPSEPSHA